MTLVEFLVKRRVQEVMCALVHYRDAGTKCRFATNLVVFF